MQAHDAYYMIFPRKRARSTEAPTLAQLPVHEEPVRGTLKVILPDGSAKTVMAKTTTRVATVLRALCSKMEWNAADYTIDEEETIVRFDCVYEIKKKPNAVNMQGIEVYVDPARPECEMHTNPCGQCSGCTGAPNFSDLYGANSLKR